MKNEAVKDAYSTPDANLDNSGIEYDERIESLAKGQKLIIYAVICYFLLLPARLVFMPVAVFVMLAMVIMGIWGIIKVLKYFEIRVIFKVLIFLTFFVPLINLVTLLVLNNRATTRLKEHGYRVGFLGAKKSA